MRKASVTLGREKIVVLIGGSLIVPDGEIDTKFLSNLNRFIRDKLAENSNRQFFLVIGGGGVTHTYQKAATGIVGNKLRDEDKDWLGIHATKLNAHLVRTIFRDIAHPYVLKHYDIIRKVTEPVIVASGEKPGWSMDYCATLLCEDYDVKKIINLSNVNKKAKPIDKISWANFRKLTNPPFDPIASEKAQDLGIRVVVLDGNDFKNLANYFSGKKFTGTIIGD